MDEKTFYVRCLPMPVEVVRRAEPQNPNLGGALCHMCGHNNALTTESARICLNCGHEAGGFIGALSSYAGH